VEKREELKYQIKFKVNGDEYSLAVDPWRTLNEVLRDDLNQTGAKLGCGFGGPLLSVSALKWLR
jgi:aerobic-type carbon monoxide dehydrogenase small subunit (CoxS/CutS family)